MLLQSVSLPLTNHRLPVSLPTPQVTLHDLDLVKEAGAPATNGLEAGFMLRGQFPWGGENWYKWLNYL